MKITFPYEEKKSDIFPKIKRPIAEVYFWSKLINGWLGYKMIVDTGADYTVLPKYRAVDLGVNLKKDCEIKKTFGVGGGVTVYFLKNKAKMKIGQLELNIPLGFLDADNVPPLLGREGCLNVFRLIFAGFQTKFIFNLRQLKSVE
ncbi:retroviral-like aspartic protease family protein [Candidatus Gottesmanbacteria bacterium]|nr:retroviral-like aspartic protease family protein [Candidatus Gottesmanbacteria bacterium]